MLPFLKIFMKVSAEKEIIDPSCPKYPKRLIEVKIHINFYFHTFVGAILRYQKEEWKQKIHVAFPSYSRLGRQGLRLIKTPDLCHFHFLSNRGTQKQNLKYKHKTSLLAHYSNLFSAPNLGIFFLVIVLYVPNYYHNPLRRYLIYSVS